MREMGDGEDSLEGNAGELLEGLDLGPGGEDEDPSLLRSPRPDRGRKVSKAPNKGSPTKQKRAEKSKSPRSGNYVTPKKP